MSTRQPPPANGAPCGAAARVRAGFTLVEILLVVAAVAILSGAAVVAIGNARESTRVGKLESDVATLNAAIQAYLVNGGSLPASATPQQILDRLKTTADAATASTIPGLRGSFVDRRLTTEMQTAAEAGTTQARALWSGANRRFVVATSGAIGVKNFRLDDSIGDANYGAEPRTPTVSVADDGWVWDYADVPPTNPAGPGGAPGTTTVTPGSLPTAPTANQLAAPVFSEAGGTLTLLNFDIPLTLSNPNPPGTSQIYYTIGGSPFALYKGETLTVTPGTAVTAYAATSDPDDWTDSNLAAHTYQAQPVTLGLALAFERTSYTFAQAGGEMVGGSPISPAPGTITLTNPAEIPATYRSSTQFDLRWTLDGTDPISSGTANVSAAFSGSVPTQNISLSPGSWGAGTTLAVRAAAKSKQAWFINSPVQSADLTVAPTVMPEPVFGSDGGIYLSELPVEIDYDEAGVRPANARIYYTTDGTDPGNVNGNPLPTATLYSGSFAVLTLDTPNATITARAYGPADYPQWFTPSDPVTIAYELFYPPPWNGYIVGQFNTTVNTAFNGIQQLNESGSLDLTFNPGSGTGTGNSNSVRDAVFQPDGKAILVGDFTVYNGTAVNRIARVNSDGSLDTTFNIGTGFNGQTTVAVVQPDGKILVGGTFTTYNGVARRNIARLNSDGSLDTTFNPGTGTTGPNNINPGVESIAVQSDGRIVIAGAFTSYNGAARNHVVRVNSDGSIDATFTTGSGPNDRVYAALVQPDGRIVLAGAFTSYNGTTQNRITRVTSTGARDTAFTIGSGANKDVYAAALQSDGKIVIGGTFGSVNGTVRKAIARLNADGTLDTGFDLGTGSGVGSYTVLTLSVDSEDRIVVGGDFPAYNPGSRANLIRVGADGSYDETFAPGELRPNTTVYTAAVGEDDKVLVGGNFTAATTTGLNNVARLVPGTGALDLTFNPGTGTDSNSLVWGLAEQEDGKILIGGDFTSVNGRSRSGIARLNTDGSVDTGFDPGAGATGGGVWTIAVQPDGKVVIGGQFTKYKGVSMAGLARLSSAGALDASFVVGAGFNGYVSSSVLQPDGKIVIGGGFTTYQGGTAKRIARVNTNGSRDATVGSTVGVDDGQVNWVGLQPDGKILFGGSFTSVGGVTRRGIARLNADGTLDETFASSNGVEAGSAINSFGLQSDGKIVIGGTFKTYGGVARPGIARVTRTGALDTAFTPGQGPTAVAPLTANVQSVIVQPDAKIIIAGSFSGYNGVAVNKIIRLNADGTYDSGFGSSSLSIKTINNTR